jgi:hypothetical protein
VAGKDLAECVPHRSDDVLAGVDQGAVEVEEGRFIPED